MKPQRGGRLLGRMKCSGALTEEVMTLSGGVTGTGTFTCPTATMSCVAVGAAYSFTYGAGAA